MALAFFERDVTEITTSATVFPGGNFTPTENGLLLACFAGRRTSDAAVDPMDGGNVAGFGLSWGQIASVQFRASRRWMHVYRAMGTPSPATDNVTVTYGTTMYGILLYVYEFTGVIPGADGDNALGNVLTNIGDLTAGSPLVVETLDPFAAGSWAFGSCGSETDPTDIVEDVGWIEHNDIGSAQVRLHTSHFEGEDRSVAFTPQGYGGSSWLGGMAVEIKAEGGPPPGSSLPVLQQQYKKHLG